MAITYPRALPNAPIARATFEPDYQTVHAPESGGEAIAVILGPARWRAEFSTSRLREPYLSRWRAWLASMENGVGSFYAIDPAKALPLAYPGGVASMTRHGGGAFDGTATSFSLDTARKVLTLNGLPSAYVASEGDHIMFSWDTSKRYLTRALETVTASAGSLAVTVSPRIESFVPSDAVVGVINAACVMKIEPGSVNTDLSPGPIGQVSFRAVQHLEA